MIMKKYIKPNIREINLNTYSLLAGSIMTVNNEDAKDSALGKEFDGMNDDWGSGDEEE